MKEQAEWAEFEAFAGSDKVENQSKKRRVVDGGDGGTTTTTNSSLSMFDDNATSVAEQLLPKEKVLDVQQAAYEARIAMMYLQAKKVGNTGNEDDSEHLAEMGELSEITDVGGEEGNSVGDSGKELSIGDIMKAKKREEKRLKKEKKKALALSEDSGVDPFDWRRKEI